MKPNLNRIIEDNLDKAKFQSKLQPSLSKNTGWLDGYADGGLLSKKVTCSNCGWSWKAVDGGIDPMTCHKCGGMIKMKEGGETYISGKALATQFGQYPVGGQAGPRQPIITNNPNDPRLKAYNDSADAYRVGEDMYKFGKKIYNDVRANYNNDFRNLHSIKQDVHKNLPFAATNIMPIETYSEHWERKPLGTFQKLFGNTPDYSFKDSNGKNWEDTGIGWSRFKKPEQEVIYQPPTQSNKQTTKPTQQTNKKPVQPVVYQKDQDLETILKDKNSYDKNGDLLPKYKNLYDNIYKSNTGKALIDYRFVPNPLNSNKGLSIPIWEQPKQIKKETTHPKPGKGEIIPIEHPSLQQGQTNQEFDRNLSTIDTSQQPTNYSFHYPIEGTFDRGNPQGVKYFNDRAEWQKFLDENDYNSAEEKNGSGQASGTLKKGKYGGWLDRYPEGGENSTGYVAPTMPDLRNVSESTGVKKVVEPIDKVKLKKELESIKDNREQKVYQSLKNTKGLNYLNDDELKSLSRTPQSKWSKDVKDKLKVQQTNDWRIQTHPDFDPSKPISSQENLLEDGTLRSRILSGRNQLMEGSTGNPVLDVAKDFALTPGSGMANLTGDYNKRYLNPKNSRLQNTYNLIEDVLAVAPELPIKGTQALNKLPGGLKKAGKYLTEKTPLKNAYKLNPYAKSAEELFTKGSLKNNIPGANPEFIQRGVADEAAIDDLLNTGIVRNRLSAGLPSKGRWKENVYWGAEGDSFASNKYNIIAKNSKGLKNRPVAYDDIKDIQVRGENGEYSSLPNWQEQINKPNWLKGYQKINVPKQVKNISSDIRPYVVNNDINNLQFFDHNTGRYIGSSQVTGMGPTYEESIEALKPKLLENKTSREFKQFIPPDYTDKGNSFLNGKPLPDIKLFNDGKPYIPEEKYGGDISIPDLNNNKQFKNNNMAKYGGWLSKYENGSVVDYLADRNQDFSYSHRKELAKELGIENYRGTADQNLQMLDKLRQSDNVVTGKRYVKPPAQGIYFEDGVDVRTPDVPQREVPKPREKQKVVNKIPEYDPFGFIKEAIKNNNTSTKSPLPQPTSAPAARKINEPSWYDKVGDWFGGMENTLSKIKENTLGRPGFIPDNNKTKFTPPNAYVSPNTSKPKVVEGTKKDSRYLESGMIEDKNKGEMYVIKNGKVVKTMPILTGLNKNGEVNDKDYKYLHDHPEEGPKLKATPTGTYLSVPNPNLYGYPGFNMNPIPAFGQLFPKGDTTIVVDSRRPADQSFLKNTYGIKKMGGEPCYNCGGMYNKGGQTNWLDKYK